MSKKICVYTSSSTRLDKKYLELAHSLGVAMGRSGHSLVYGAGVVGMMGEVADGMREENGTIYGFIPERLNIKGIAYEHCTHLEITPDMYTRKKKMSDLADAFIVLPGGFGTMDEFFDVLTLKQLGYMDKPIVILQLDGFFDGLIQQLSTMFSENFTKVSFEKYYHVAFSIDEALQYIDNYEPVGLADKW